MNRSDRAVAELLVLEDRAAQHARIWGWNRVGVIQLLVGFAKSEALRAAAQPPAPGDVDLGDLTKHGTNCGFFDSEIGCTCSLKWRIALSTERAMHRAWRKRAEEAEAPPAQLQGEVAEVVRTLRNPGPHARIYADFLKRTADLIERFATPADAIAREREEWRTDLESAPKDGTLVDLWSPTSGRHTDAAFNNERYTFGTPWGWGSQRLGRITDATHWMPIPRQPRAASPDLTSPDDMRFPT